MPDDDFDVLPPDPLLAGSDGDESSKLNRSARSAKLWLGAAAGVGVGSAAIMAAMMFWGKKEHPVQAAPPATPRKQKRPIAASSSSDSSGD